MRVVVASDHAGFCQKELIVEFIRTLGHEVEDLGPFTDVRCDYPDFAEKAARRVADGTADRAVLLCGTGIGMAMTADKVPGIRAANVVSTAFARLARAHNDANVLALSGRFVAPTDNCDIIETFLTTEFAGGRHTERVEKIMRPDDY